MPLSALAGFVSDHTYQSRWGEAGSRRADWNQGWASEVWLTTRSISTWMPRWRAAWVNSTKSPSEP